MDGSNTVEAQTKVTSRTASSVHDITAEKPPFGSRFLTNEADVWSQNAWDHVPPPDDQDETIAAALAKQRSAPVPDDEKSKYNEKPAKHWDNFYKMNASNFFKTRKWLHLEFPELVAATQAEAGPLTIAEIGCGTGSAVFPLLSSNQNPDLSLRAYDYSNHAVKLVQNNPLYLSAPIGSIKAAVWDLSSNNLPPEAEPGSVDVITMIFVLSALHPHEWAQAISNVYRLLKPGGLLRFKGGRLLDENFYIRETKRDPLLQEPQPLSDPAVDPIDSASQPALHPNQLRNPVVEERTDTSRLRTRQYSTSLFKLNSGVDRRLIMYRVWMQGKFRKL
ncbi:S-adenosyl-L-methionine-dependent methyltransferase [Irpex lacteus]|nr:S-adenosyl-L-methionine-dependent methyltransferase [Irpex lacteus]